MASIEYEITVAAGVVSIVPAFGTTIELRTGDVLSFSRATTTPPTNQPIRVELTKHNGPRLSCALPSEVGGISDQEVLLKGSPILEPGPPDVFVIGFTEVGPVPAVPFAQMTFRVGVGAGAVHIDPGVATKLHSNEVVTFLPELDSQTIQAELIDDDVDLVEFLVAGIPFQKTRMLEPKLDNGNILITFAEPGPGGNGGTKPFP
jgi:hypothetical protein